jgi:hypothetical protein
VDTLPANVIKKNMFLITHLSSCLIIKIKAKKKARDRYIDMHTFLIIIGCYYYHFSISCMTCRANSFISVSCANCFFIRILSRHAYFSRNREKRDDRFQLILTFSSPPFDNHNNLVESKAVIVVQT